MQTRCPHCSAPNLSDANFCESCGKALPQTEASGPQIVSGPEVASTNLGRSLQSEQLQEKSKKAAGALLAVAILQVIFATIIVYLAMQEVDQNPELQIDPAVIGTVYGIGVFFFALFLWARKSPLPAAIVGLVAFLSLHLLEAVADPTSIARGLIVKIIILVVLGKAIQAGIQHRRISASFHGEEDE